MIRYSIVCPDGHEFDGWFRSGADFDAQAARDLVECPVCGKTGVRKAIMAPAVSGTRKSADAPPSATASDMPAATPDTGRPDMAVPVTSPFDMGVDPRARAMLEALRTYRDRMLEGSTDVGQRFAEEARRMHHGEAERKGIHGQATREEAEALVDEGIPIAPLPVLPDDYN